MINKTITFIGIIFVIRLLFTTQPPVEYEHTWRQSTGLMYARNFVETDANFFHPRIDDNAVGTGILVLEAPILYYGMYLMSIPFGYQDWYGRLINLIVSSLGLYFFFLLVCRFFTERLAFYAMLILTTSLWLIYSRKTMQDTMAVSFLFMALHVSFQYFERGGWHRLTGYIILAILGMLAKIPAALYLFFPVFYLWRCAVSRQRIIGWSIATLVPLSLTIGWYFIYAPYASEKYGYWYNLGEPFPEGLMSLIVNAGQVLERFFFQSFHSFVFLALFLMSWFLLIRLKSWEWVALFGGFTILFGLYMIRSGTYFVQHNYYMIPYIPVMSVMIAWVLTEIPKRRWAVVLLVIGMMEGTAWVARDFTNSPREEYKMELTAIVNEFIDPEDMIVLVNGGNPIGFYFAHRKGWLQSEEAPLPEERIKELSDAGARLLIIHIRERDHTYELPLVYEDENYRVYKLGV